MESLGLLITLTLGGLGMFLVVLVVTFVLAKVPKLSQVETRRLEQDWFLWSILVSVIKINQKIYLTDLIEFVAKTDMTWDLLLIPILSSGCNQAPGVWEIQWVWRVLPGGVRQRLYWAYDVLQQWEEGHLCHWGGISIEDICCKFWFYLLQDVEGCILTPHKFEEPMEKFEDMQPRRLQSLTKLWGSLTSGRLKENLFGSKFIELKP